MSQTKTAKFTECILCAKHSSKQLKFINIFNFIKSGISLFILTDKETGTKRFANIPQLVKNSTTFKFRPCGFRSHILNHLTVVCFRLDAPMINSPVISITLFL